MSPPIFTSLKKGAMTKKTYRSIHSLSLTLCIEADGQSRFIQFTGGFKSPRRQNGSFSTTNTTIQTTLEKHPRFNVDFALTKVTQINSPGEQVQVLTPDGVSIGVPEGSVIIEAAKKPEVVDQPKKEGYISRVKNGQLAKDELNKVFGVPWSKLKNLDQVRSEAAKLNIVYSDWKP